MASPAVRLEVGPPLVREEQRVRRMEMAACGWVGGWVGGRKKKKVDGSVVHSSTHPPTYLRIGLDARLPKPPINLQPASKRAAHTLLPNLIGGGGGRRIGGAIGGGLVGGDCGGGADGVGHHAEEDLEGLCDRWVGGWVGN